jgi:hypothetical protein
MRVFHWALYENICWVSRHAFSLSPFHTLRLRFTFCLYSCLLHHSTYVVIFRSVWTPEQASCYTGLWPSFRRREIEFALAHHRLSLFRLFQFTIQISFQDGGHSMSDYFSIKQFLHLWTNFTVFFCGFCIYAVLSGYITTLKISKNSTFRAKALRAKALRAKALLLIFKR